MIKIQKIKTLMTKIGDYFSTMCFKCDKKGIKTRMNKNYYMLGMPDSMYWTCEKCGYKQDMPDILE